MMIFGNPWAWLGLLALAAPIAAHLLARRPARRQPFPHLRFLPAAAIRPVRRDRLADVALLALRCAIVAAAAAALAQPFWRSPGRARDLDAQIARAIVVDASASMARPARERGSAATLTALEAARRAAAEAARGAAVSRTAEAADAGAAVARAQDWLASQPMRRELVVISDFQPAAIARADLDAVPETTGVRLIDIAVAEGPAPAAGAGGAPAWRAGSSDPAASATAETVRLLAGEAERGAAEAARSAAAAGQSPRIPAPNRSVAIVFPGFAGREALLSAGARLNQPWMSDAYVAVLADPLVRSAADRLARQPADLVTAHRGLGGEAGTLMLVLHQPAHTVASAAVIAAAWTASSHDPVTSQHELSAPSRSRAELAGWERPPAASAPGSPGSPASSGSAALRPPVGQSDGRWFWVAALVLLALEAVIRRRPRPASSVEFTDARRNRARVA